MSAQRFGAFVREVRQTQGVSGVTLAKACDVTPSHVSDIEHGRRGPSESLLWRLARALDLDVFALHAMVGRIPNACVPASYGKAFAAGEAWRKATKCAPRCPTEHAAKGSHEPQAGREA